LSIQNSAAFESRHMVKKISYPFFLVTISLNKVRNL
jgi:hypothetical protein